MTISRRSFFGIFAAAPLAVPALATEVENRIVDPEITIELQPPPPSLKRTIRIKRSDWSAPRTIRWKSESAA